MSEVDSKADEAHEFIDTVLKRYNWKDYNVSSLSLVFRGCNSRDKMLLGINSVSLDCKSLFSSVRVFNGQTRNLTVRLS